MPSSTYRSEALSSLSRAKHWRWVPFSNGMCKLWIRPQSNANTYWRPMSQLLNTYRLGINLYIMSVEGDICEIAAKFIGNILKYGSESSQTLTLCTPCSGLRTPHLHTQQWVIQTAARSGKLCQYVPVKLSVATQWAPIVARHLSPSVFENKLLLLLLLLLLLPLLLLLVLWWLTGVNHQ